MQTIITYNESEIKELKEFQNIKSEDKVWIDIANPDEELIKSIAAQFHLDSSAIELFRNKSKKPQIRLLEDHTFTIFAGITEAIFYSELALLFANFVQVSR